MQDNFWYIIKTRRLFERKFATHLLRFPEFTIYLPLRQEFRQWSDRKKKVTVPLIPGYLFLKCKASDLSILYNSAHFMGVLSEGGQHVTLAEPEIDRLKELEQEDPIVITSDFDMLKTNDIYTFKDNIFKDISSTVIDNNLKSTLFVLHTSSFPFRLVIRKKAN